MFELLTDISFWSFPFYFLIILFAYGIVVDNFVTPRRKLTDFKNKHVFITGGSSGLGKSIAVNFAREGAHVTIVARDVKKLEDAKKEIEVSFVDCRSILISSYRALGLISLKKYWPFLLMSPTTKIWKIV